MMVSAWSGDWKARVRDRAARLGYSNVMAVFQAHPGIPFGQVFRMLRDSESEDDRRIAYVQLQAVYFEEAERNGRLREVLADVVVRKLREHLRKGWSTRKSLSPKRAMMMLHIEVPPSYLAGGALTSNRIWAVLEELSPSDDWCPENINDPLIQEFVHRILTPGNSDSVP